MFNVQPFERETKRRANLSDYQRSCFNRAGFLLFVELLFELDVIFLGRINFYLRNTLLKHFPSI